jgi:rubrerythrin
MTQLKAEPPAPVRSMAELFAIALALEEEAAGRYRELAGKMREHGATSTAAVFDHLAQEESGHREEIIRWSEQQSGKSPNLADIHWHIPQTFDDEGIADMPGSRIVTPYRALSMAVRNEERAFAFWSYIASRAEDVAVRKAAETMAREELEHVSLLRRERRHAYHAAGGGQTRLGQRTTPAEALAEAAELELGLAGQLEDLPHQSPDVQTRLHELAKQSRRMAGVVPRPAASRSAGATRHEPSDIEEILATAEYLTERYLEAADHARDEATMTEAQALAELAITRLASLRAISERGRNIGEGQQAVGQ